jgi:hypothetical protein
MVGLGKHLARMLYCLCCHLVHNKDVRLILFSHECERLLASQSGCEEFTSKMQLDEIKQGHAWWLHNNKF